MARERIGARRPDRDAYMGSRAAVGLVATITGMLICAIAVQPARAGTYVMRTCSVPGHGDSLLHPWRTSFNPPDVSIVDSCANGGGAAITLGNTRRLGGGASPFIAIESPTGARSQIKFVKLMLWYAARLAGSGQALRFWSGDARSDGSFHPALSHAPPGSEYILAEQQLSPETTSVQLGIQCGPGGVISPEPCVAEHSVPLLIRGLELTLSEDVPPIVLRPGGSLLEGSPQSGVRSLTYSASDLQSGLSRIDVLLGETVVASQDLSSRCSHSDFTVCPASLDESLQVDTRAVTNGAYRLTVRVQDAAGNERLAHGDSNVEVANAPTLPRYTLVANFNGTSRTTLTVPYGRRASLRGRLQGSDPVAAGIPIEVLETLDRKGKREVAAAQVETKADGSFSVRLKTNRPSRTLRLVYRPNGVGEIASRTLRLRVRAASRLRASLRGRVVRFSGRVFGGPIAKRGKRVLMEGRSPGSAWTQFRSFRTDRRGRFSGTYRLRVRRPGVVLKIRAVVPTEDGYGYVGSRSRAVSLRVR